MFSRLIRTQGLRHGKVATNAGFQAPMLARGMATEQQLKKRIKTVANIEKITGAMRMVATAKLRRSQLRLEHTREFADDMIALWPQPEIEDDKESETVKRYMPIPFTVDRGLCGGVNSQVTRDVRDKLLVNKESGKFEDPAVFTIGEKARNGLDRLFGDINVCHINEVGKGYINNFNSTTAMADLMLSQEADRIDFVHNWFKNMLTFETHTDSQYSYDIMSQNATETFQGQEMEGDNDILRNLHEFITAVRVWLYFAETETCELSSRMNAMGNSSKNATDMLGKLTLLYNRTRQAKITTELIEIISGASAAAEQQAED